MPLQRVKQFVAAASPWLGVALLSSLPLAAAAQAPTTCSDLVALLTRIAKFFSAVVIAVAIIVLLIGAFYFIFAGGSEEGAKKGRTYLIFGLVGVGVALVAFALPLLVQNVFGITTSSCP